MEMGKTAGFRNICVALLSCPAVPEMACGYSPLPGDHNIIT